MPRVPPLLPYPMQSIFAIMLSMSVGELARLIGRSVDTIKRWEKSGLIIAERDSLGRRRFTNRQVERCVELGKMALEAQRASKSLTQLASEREPLTLSLTNDLSS